MNLKSIVPFGRQGRNLAHSDADALGSLQREIDRLFDDFSRGFGGFGSLTATTLLPSMDVAETDNEIEITAELPGLEQKDVDIRLADNVLTIRGEKKTETEQKDKKKNYQFTERSYGAFYRALELPPGVNPSAIKATMSKGVLKVTVPKPAHTDAKKIEVKEAA